MATQRSSMMMRCAENEEEEEELKNNQTKKIIKQQCSSSSTSMIHGRHQNKSWSELDWDMLREINNKLCNYYADAIAFRGVCKSWRAAAGLLKTAGDVLPWFISTKIDDNILRYKLYEPSFLPICNSTSSTIMISDSINLGAYYFKRAFPSEILRYVNGWLHVSLFTFQGNISYFLFFSLLAPKTSSFKLPPLNDSSNHIFLELSTATPDSPDCVFLTLWLEEHDYTIKIGILRHGDAHWTIITQSVKPCFDISIDMAAVFVSGVFYFVDRAGIGSYDLATGALKLDRFSTPLQFYEIYSFFGLDGDLMLAYFEDEDEEIFRVKKYDGMNKVWVPLQTLGGRSLYINPDGFPYVDHINYYGISSNKIYVRANNEFYRFVEYTLEEDGLLYESPARELVRWPGLTCRMFAMWVSPLPHVLLRE